MKASLEQMCTQTLNGFATRTKKRSSEVDGLVEAKNFLAGVEAGEPVLAPAA
jgi:hypothetical protein